MVDCLSPAIQQHRLPARAYDERMNPPLTINRAHGVGTTMPPTMQQPLRILKSSPQLPSQADVVVIGGGIIGAFAAYYMARRGLSVALLEKGRIGAEQSSRNWGWCRQQNRDARELPMATRSLELWEQFAADSGEDTGFSRCGLMYLSNDEDEIARWAKWRDFARTAGVTTHMLSGREATERGQATGRAWKGGVFSPSDGTADPGKAAPAVAAALMKLGGTVHQSCAARGIELEGGRVSGVVTEAGTIKTRTAVYAGGAWASSFCRQLGIRFPQATVRQTIVRVPPMAQQLPDALHTARVSITRRSDGSYNLAISGRGRVDPTLQLLRFAPQFLPMFAKRWRNVFPGGLEGIRGGHETLAR
jgi:glycine/D-amino acid oxidase-like deaminating enzyme